ncbi:MAG TPA: YihY/virulence factor BrkB family protein, partial [Actinomycetota bacterium]|nr:YihY/virulence factor BrkB family protein [Actinomycetota bacterium]
MSQLRRGDASPDAPVPTKKSGTGGPDHPLELSKNDWKMTLKRTMKEVKDDRITLVAAGMAFYWFLAVFPALIAAVGVVDLLGLGQQMLESINQAIGSTIPGGAAAILTTTIEAAQDAPRRTSLVAAIIGVTLALFGATAGMVALQAGLDVAYDVAEDRKFFKKRAYALLLVVATGLLIAIPSVFFAAGGLIWSILGWLTLVAAIITL